MARVFITGGAGFVGSHTSRQLLDAGHEVLLYDLFHQYSYPPGPTYLANTEYRYEVLLKGAEILRGNTLNRDALRNAIIDTQPDVLIHLAALPLANVALRQTEEAFNSILVGTVNMLEVARGLKNLQRFVYASSSMVYGDFTQIPMPEDGKTSPKDIYGGMKLAGEVLVRVFSQRYDIPSVMIRPSAVYGPTDNNYRVLQIFLERARRGEPITIKNPATKLDFTYVEDTAQGFMRAALTPDVAGRVFNITRGEGRSLGEAAELIRGYFPDLKIEIDKNPAGFRPNRGALDVRAAGEALGYHPKYSLEEGLRTYLDWMREFNSGLEPAGPSSP